MFENQLTGNLIMKSDHGEMKHKKAGIGLPAFRF